MDIVTLPPMQDGKIRHTLNELYGLGVKAMSVKDEIHNITSLTRKSEYAASCKDAAEHLIWLFNSITEDAKTERISRTAENVTPLIGKYWVVRTDEKSEPFAIIHPYEFERSTMSSLVVYLCQPNYECSLKTAHIGILYDNEDPWSGPLHFTEITEEDFHKRIADGIDNIFKYREYRKEQTIKK